MFVLKRDEITTSSSKFGGEIEKKREALCNVAIVIETLMIGCCKKASDWLLGDDL